ncbi:MAG: EVE domain-containing protein [Acetobacteraceae bacterium]
MQHWLLKSEPDAFGWPQQVESDVEPWTGVRNHAAKRNLMEMRRGDLAFFYHSGLRREIVGVVEIVREAYADPTAQDGGWVAVDVKTVTPLPRPVRLSSIKADPVLANLDLVRQSRLSVVRVGVDHWRRLAAMGGLRA